MGSSYSDYDDVPEPLHMILGRYISVWGNTERIFFRIYSKLHGDYHGAHYIFWNKNISWQCKIRLVKFLAKEKMSSEEWKEFRSVIKKLKRLTIVRNALVHGFWEEIELGPDHSKPYLRDEYSYEWFRIGRSLFPADHLTAMESGESYDPKYCHENVYSLERIEECTDELLKFNWGLGIKIGDVYRVPVPGETNETCIAKSGP